MTLPRFRLSIATVMMLVVTAASASALAARVLRVVAVLSTNTPLPKYDMAALLVLGIVLTGVALAARKGHSANQAMLQVTLSCLGFLYAISLFELSSERAQFYWLQSLFAVLVAGPLVARRVIKNQMDRGPRRRWWLATCEAVAFAYLNMLLVLAGIGIEVFVIMFFH